MTIVCLDSWAVLAWLADERPAATLVDELLDERRPAMSWINVCEVAYITHRRRDAVVMHTVVDHLRSRTTLDPVTPERVLEAATIKAEHPMALGDAFAVATASAHDAELWTGDPEILGADIACLRRDLRDG